MDFSNNSSKLGTSRKLPFSFFWLGLVGVIFCTPNKDLALMTLGHDIVKKCALFPSSFSPSACKNTAYNQLIDSVKVSELKNRLFSYLYTDKLKPLVNENSSIIRSVKQDKDLNKYTNSFAIPSGFDITQIAQLKDGKSINSHEYVYLLECLTGSKMIVPDQHKSCGTDMFDKIVELLLSFDNN